MVYLGRRFRHHDIKIGVMYLSLFRFCYIHGFSWCFLMCNRIEGRFAVGRYFEYISFLGS